MVSAADLCAALALLFADVPADRSCAAAHVIVEVATATGEDPALLAALAHRESRYVATAVNSTSGACGPMAVLYSRDRAVQARRCRAVLASPRAGYMAGAVKLRDARAFCRRRGTPTARCAMAGFAGGPALVRRGAYSGRAVLMRAARIRRAMALCHSEAS